MRSALTLDIDNQRLKLPDAAYTSAVMDRLGRYRDIVPRDYPELGLLVWNRDVTRAITADEAFRLYERNWKHVCKERMIPEEQGLVAALVELFGHGVMLT